MKALLNPIIVKELGQVILKPGSELLPLFQGRVLVGSEPNEFKSLPSGRLPDVSQHLSADQRLTPFFQNKRVIAAAGGVSSLISRLERLNKCQWQSESHDRNITTLRYGLSAIRMCWHHEVKYRHIEEPRLEALANANLAEWVVDHVRGHFLLPKDHQLTWPELCYWAVIRGVHDLLPDSIAAAALRLPERIIATGTRKEVDMDCTPSAREIIQQYIEPIKPVVAVDVDPEPPAGFMLRPKMMRWENAKYTRWVKSLPCCCGCGQQADDPHHIIDHGFGGTGTKPSDIFTIPLTRQCHNRLHDDVAAWEAEHGSQLYHLARTLDRAFGIGAIITANKRGAKV